MSSSASAKSVMNPATTWRQLGMSSTSPTPWPTKDWSRAAWGRARRWEHARRWEEGDPVTVAIFGLLVFLAAMNGANDVSKGIATLAGAGVTRYRTAIAWGTVTTLGGCLLSLTVAAKLTALFSKGIVSHPPTNAFTLAVLVGAGAWVAIATLTRLPVSTTQAIIGALVGAGLLLGLVAAAAATVAIKLATALAGQAA